MLPPCEHLVHQKPMMSLVNIRLVMMKFANDLLHIFGHSLLGFWIIYFITWKLWPYKAKEIFHLKYTLTTNLPLLACALLPHVHNPQFYPIWSSHLLTYIHGPKGRGTTSSSSRRNLDFLEASKVVVFSCDGPIKLVNNPPLPPPPPKKKNKWKPPFFILFFKKIYFFFLHF